MPECSLDGRINSPVVPGHEDGAIIIDCDDVKRAYLTERSYCNPPSKTTLFFNSRALLNYVVNGMLKNRNRSSSFKYAALGL